MRCNNFSCRDVAVGWREERGIVIDDFKVLKEPVDKEHFFEIWVTGKADHNVYQLLVNNTIIRDNFTLNKGETKEYLNGLLRPGERLTLIIEGEAKFKLKWIRKPY